MNSTGDYDDSFESSAELGSSSIQQVAGISIHDTPIGGRTASPKRNLDMFGLQPERELLDASRLRSCDLSFKLIKQFVERTEKKLKDMRKMEDYENQIRIMNGFYKSAKVYMEILPKEINALQIFFGDNVPRDIFQQKAYLESLLSKTQEDIMEKLDYVKKLFRKDEEYASLKRQIERDNQQLNVGRSPMPTAMPTRQFIQPSISYSLSPSAYSLRSPSPSAHSSRSGSPSSSSEVSTRTRSKNKGGRPVILSHQTQNAETGERRKLGVSRKYLCQTKLPNGDWCPKQKDRIINGIKLCKDHYNHELDFRVLKETDQFLCLANSPSSSGSPIVVDLR